VAPAVCLLFGRRSERALHARLGRATRSTVPPVRFTSCCWRR